MRAPRRAAGFSILELLLVSSVGLLLLGAILTLLVSYVRSRERVEAVLRLQEHWGRVQFLLDREIQESTPVTAASSVNSRCAAVAPILALEVPGLSDRIVYYRSGSALRRCGPRTDAAGHLSGSVSDDLVIEGVSDFSIDSSDPQRPIYRLSLTAAHGVTYSNSSQPSAASFRARTIN